MTYHDLPRTELIAMAEKVARETRGQGIPVDVYFKFTCEKCGQRCMFEKANEVFEYGECDRCGHDTPFTKGGFSLYYKLNQD